MVNAFNLMSKGAIFQKLCIIGKDIIQFIPFVCAFYAFEFLLFNNHCNHEGDVMIIPFAIGTHQGDFLGGALFALVQFRALHSIINHFPSCLFPSITNNIHIIGPFHLYHLHMNIFKPNFM